MRFDFDTYKEISDSLTRNKSRSLLTGFGIFWGIFMLLFLLGGGDGFKVLLSNNFNGFASNTIVIVANNTSKPYKGFRQNRLWELNYTDVERLKTMVPELAVVVPQVTRWGQDAVNGEYKYDAIVKGVYPEQALVEAPKMKFGRYLNDVDILQERKVCVIGKAVYKNLFPDGGNPCGEYIQVGPSYYRIIGVDYSETQISVNGSGDQSILIPLPLAQKIFQRGNSVDIICVAAISGVTAEQIEPKIRSLLSRAHDIDPEDKAAIVLLNVAEFFALIDNLFRGVNFLILLIGIGTILAGAIGVSNIMMVTVKERTTEIGIRRAIGATPRDILFQIMAESVALTAIAGSLGITFTVLALNILEKVNTAGVNFQISFNAAIIALLFLSVLGILAGLAPASRAMKIKPVDAMRDE